jgi:hypothetical protein
MFPWLKSIFRKPDRRLIFEYTVGGERRTGDPLEIDRLLVRCGGEDWGLIVDGIAKLKTPLTPIAELAIGPEVIAERRRKFDSLVDQAVQLARQVFELPKLESASGKGYTSIEALGVLTQYVNFAAELAERSRPKSNSPGPLEPSPAN